MWVGERETVSGRGERSSMLGFTCSEKPRHADTHKSVQCSSFLGKFFCAHSCIRMHTMSLIRLLNVVEQVICNSADSQIEYNLRSHNHC